MHLGEPAAEVEGAGAVGQRRVAGGVDLDDSRTRRFEQLDGLGVAEGEGAAPGDGHDDPPSGRMQSTLLRARGLERREGGGRGPRLEIEVGGRAGGREQRVEVEVLLGDGGDVVEGRGGLPALGGGDEAEVAGGHVHPDVPRHDPPDRHPGLLHRAACLVGVTGGAGGTTGAAGAAGAPAGGAGGADGAPAAAPRARSIVASSERAASASSGVLAEGRKLASAES